LFESRSEIMKSTFRGESAVTSVLGKWIVVETTKAIKTSLVDVGTTGCVVVHIGNLR